MASSLDSSLNSPELNSASSSSSEYSAMRSVDYIYKTDLSSIKSCLQFQLARFEVGTYGSTHLLLLLRERERESQRHCVCACVCLLWLFGGVAAACFFRVLLFILPFCGTWRTAGSFFLRCCFALVYEVCSVYSTWTAYLITKWRAK